jgi:hypothetical protein
MLCAILCARFQVNGPRPAVTQRFIYANADQRLCSVRCTAKVSLLKHITNILLIEMKTASQSTIHSMEVSNALNPMTYLAFEVPQYLSCVIEAQNYYFRLLKLNRLTFV